MTDKIKDFFNKKFKDAKFKMAGSGRKLTDGPNEGSSNNTSSVESVSRIEPSREAKMAGIAALQRFQTTTEPKNPSSIKKSVKKILEAEATAEKQISSSNSGRSDIQFSRQHSKEKEVGFICPLIGPDILSKQDWIMKIKSYIEEILGTDKDPTYIVLLIKSVNDYDKAEFASEKLKLCLKNVIDHPSEEKYKKIKVNNPLFRDKILPIDGSELFLISAGFERLTIDEIEYFIYPHEEPDITLLNRFIDSLSNTDPIKLTLDRNVKVSKGYKQSDNIEPDGFFHLSKEELKLEAAKRREVIEDMQVLKTKAMREKEMNRPVYDYTTIKIKFPGDIFMQGTFAVNETLNDVRKFIIEHLKKKSESFTLSVGLGKCIDDNNKTLLEEKLVPSALLHFEWSGEDADENGYLCDDLLALLS